MGFRIEPAGRSGAWPIPKSSERESQEETTTKFEQERKEERATTTRVAEDIQDAPLTERDDG